MKHDLIKDLIFSDNLEYEINLRDYNEDIYEYEYFIDEIRIALIKSGISIKESVVSIGDKHTWILNLKK